MNKKTKAIALATASALALVTHTQAMAAPLLPNERAVSEASDVTQWSNAWIEIDTAAFERNLTALQEHLGDTQICPTMKADAYGHGISLLMPTVIAQGISCVGITSNEEARVVRESGFEARIVRLRAAPLGEMLAGMQYGVEEMVGNLDVARTLAEAAASQETTVPFHLALNSGEMSRNGMEVDSNKQQALEILQLKGQGLEPVGIMTHFALEDKAKIREGVKEFKEDANWLINQAGLDRSNITLHAANSFLTMELPEAHFDMVRPGRILYGDSSYPQFDRLMTFKTRVASVNDYPANAGVVYGHTYTLERDSKLANIPVGYSDGYRRIFANQGNVLINGQRAPVVGGITMNTFMVDVTDIPNVNSGDEVVIFGKQGEEEITATELQNIMNEIMVDMYSVWSQTNPKIPH
ncbi:alanine racemase [Halomonas halocynthiae]|uniref:alanine racemase n=1 Tax=Halomonas halocynthiae TaxID=176290 RepID=UPI0003F7313E|nr:alanine racemase [Halomonas halocynthiae]